MYIVKILLVIIVVQFVLDTPILKENCFEVDTQYVNLFPVH